MTNKKSMIEDVKISSVKREIFIYLKDHFQNPNKKIKRDFCHKFSDINKNIRKHLDNISKLSYLLPVKISVTLTSPSFPRIDESIDESLNIIDGLGDLRIIVNFEEIENNKIEKIVETNTSITHLIELSFYNHSQNDFNSTPFPTTTIYINDLDELLRYIEDIMLDICMYYTIFNDNVIFDNNFRRALSRKKVDYVKDKKISSGNWNVEIQKDYISFASLCKEKNILDYHKYINIWTELGSELSLKNDLKIFPDIIDQLKNHRDFGELSTKYIVNEFSKLNKGEYVLVRIISIPRRHKSQRSLLALFGGSILKRGRCKLFPKDKMPNINGLEQCLSLFKLVK